jgi:HNH endonuclease
MDAATRTLVRARAGNCCEYCGMAQSVAGVAPFHVEHIRSRQHSGSDDPSNLALACAHCNLHKGPNLTGIDPDTDQLIPLFNPRRDSHEEHFAFDGIFIRGLTPAGRATVELLAMNAPGQLEVRAQIGRTTGS